jgi:hypothetical protein
MLRARRLAPLAVLAVVLLVLAGCNPSGTTIEGRMAKSAHRAFFGTLPADDVSCSTARTYEDSLSEDWEGTCSFAGKTFRIVASYTKRPTHGGGHQSAIVVALHGPWNREKRHSCTFDHPQSTGEWIVRGPCGTTIP